MLNKEKEVGFAVGRRLRNEENRPVERVEVGGYWVSYPGPRDVWGPRCCSKIQSTPDCAI